MAVVLPQVLVFQDLNTVPSEITDPLRPFVCGPEYDLHRYGVASEKLKNGSYAQAGGNTFNWVTDLGRTSGASVDLNYTKVFLEKALLQYYKNASGGDANTVCAVPAGRNNRVKLTSVNLKTANNTTRDALFYTRDVQVGDYAKIETTASGNTTFAQITGFAAEPTSATTGSVVVDAANATVGNGTNGTAGGYTGTITATISGSYDGTTIGLTHETYTVVFTQGSTGNSPATVLYDVISASGKDTQRNVAYSGSATTIGSGTPSNDAAFTINSAGLGNLTFKLAYTSGTDVQRGWGFTVTVNGTYVLVSPTSAGTYTGVQDTKYIVKVVRGGTVSGNTATCPIVQVTTNTGYDTGGNVNITAAGTYNIGNYGIQFVTGTAAKLIYGDKWYIPVTAPGVGAVQTIILDKTLDSTLVAAGDLNVTLYMSKSVELKPRLYGNATVINWTQTSTALH